jgi:hypothetical protein
MGKAMAMAMAMGAQRVPKFFLERPQVDNPVNNLRAMMGWPEAWR